MFTLSTESNHDEYAIDSLLDEGFGPDRHDLTVYRLRLGPAPSTARFVAHARGELVGTLRFWPILIGADTTAVLLGPLAVTPRHQGQGLGKRLVAHGLAAMHQQGEAVCVVVGAPDFYRPFGFEPAAEHGLSMPGPIDASRFLVRALDGECLTNLLPPGDRRLRPRRWVRGGGVTVRLAWAA